MLFLGAMQTNSDEKASLEGQYKKMRKFVRQSVIANQTTNLQTSSHTGTATPPSKNGSNGDLDADAEAKPGRGGPSTPAASSRGDKEPAPTGGLSKVANLFAQREKDKEKEKVVVKEKEREKDGGAAQVTAPSPSPTPTPAPAPAPAPAPTSGRPDFAPKAVERRRSTAVTGPEQARSPPTPAPSTTAQPEFSSVQASTSDPPPPPPPAQDTPQKDKPRAKPAVGGLSALLGEIRKRNPDGDDGS